MSLRNSYRRVLLIMLWSVVWFMEESLCSPGSSTMRRTAALSSCRLDEESIQFLEFKLYVEQSPRQDIFWEFNNATFHFVVLNGT